VKLRTTIRRAVLAGLVMCLLTLAPAASAHDLGVARATLEEMPGGHYVLEVETEPALAELLGAPELPARCTPDREDSGAASDVTVLSYRFACAGEPLTARDVLVLPWQRQGAMVTARWLDGSTARQFFASSGAVIEVPLAALQAGSGSLSDMARRYVALGIEHILLGVDHLLFVFGLLLIVRGRWMLVKTITAFTLAHSVTLALATLGIVAVPARPVDAAIALSIVFLAAEILHIRQGRPGLAARKPWLVAFAFGLLHGLGFAGALTQLGLPQSEIPLALLFFNVGVEIGQLMFVATLLALAWALRQLQVRWPRWAEPLPAYAIGTVAGFWFIERTSGFLAIT
jgi:HupE / UreJ protein